MNTYAAVLKEIISGGTIAYHAIFAKAFRSAPVGIFLSQAYFLQENAKYRTDKTHRIIDGKMYFCKTASDWQDDTGLSLEQQMKVRETLRSTQVLYEKKIGLPSQLFMHIDFENLVLVLNQYLETGRKVLVDNRTKNRFKTRTRLGIKPEQCMVKNQNNIESLESKKESKKESLAENEFQQGFEVDSLGVQKKEKPSPAAGFRVIVLEGHEDIIEPEQLTGMAEQQEQDISKVRRGYKDPSEKKPRTKTAKAPSDGVIQAMVQAFEYEHRQHFKDAGGEWIGFTWQNKEFPALNAIKQELAKRYKNKMQTDPAPENIVDSWALFLRKAATCDTFTLTNLFTPSKLWGQFQAIIQKIHSNNGKPVTTGKLDQNQRNALALENMVRDIKDGRF